MQNTCTSIHVCNCRVVDIIFQYHYLDLDLVWLQLRQLLSVDHEDDFKHNQVSTKLIPKIH